MSAETDEEALEEKLCKELSVSIAETVIAFYTLNKNLLNENNSPYIHKKALAIATVAALESESELYKRPIMTLLANYIKYLTGLAVESSGNEKDKKSYADLLVKMENLKNDNHQ